MKSIQLAFACLAAFMALGVAAVEDGVKVDLSVPDELRQGEPLPVAERVENKSNASRSIFLPQIQSDRFGRHTVSFDIIASHIKSPFSDIYTTMNPRSPTQITRPDIYVSAVCRSREPGPIPVVKLPPKGVAEYSFSLFYDFSSYKTRRKLLFKNTGKYSLRAAIYELDEGGDQSKMIPNDGKMHEVPSEFKEFTVIPPENKDESAAFSDLWMVEDEYLLYAPEYFGELRRHLEGVPQLREYLKKHRNTNLGRRAALPLGMAVSQGVIEDEDGDIQRALEELSRSKLKDASALATDVLKRMSDAKERKAQEKQGGANGG